MTNKKQRISKNVWVVSILAALMFGGFSGSPAPALLKSRIPEAAPAFSEMIRQAKAVHNSIATDKSTEKKKTENIAEMKIQSGNPAAEGKKANNADEIQAAAASGTGIEAAAGPTGSGIELIVSEPPAELQPDYICLDASRGGIANRKEKDVLVHLINAEAYGLSYKAKVAVGQVVMNRWTGPYYGNDLLAIMTAPHQFTPIYNGSAYKKEVEPDSVKAADAVLNGAGVNELTNDTYYFVNPDFTQDKTIEQKMVFVCEIEGIHFYKPPAR